MEKQSDSASQTGEVPVGSTCIRWRDNPDNAALAKKSVDIGALGEQTAQDVMAYHERHGSDPGPVFRHAIYSQNLGGKPYLDTTGMATELDSFEQDIVDQLIGGELHTEKIV
jgi:hypothetical protein